MKKKEQQREEDQATVTGESFRPQHEKIISSPSPRSATISMEAAASQSIIPPHNSPLWILSYEIHPIHRQFVGVKSFFFLSHTSEERKKNLFDCGSK